MVLFAALTFVTRREAGRTLVHWQTFKDLAGSLVQDVKRIRDLPLLPSDIPICGFIYDVKTGKLLPVGAATEAGRVG